jgi:Fe-S cluster assembly protein SufD
LKWKARSGKTGFLTAEEIAMATKALKKEKDVFEKIDKNEPEWLRNTRKNNWITFNDTPLPNRVGHLWRYTDPADFLIENPPSVIVAPPMPSNNNAPDPEMVKSEYSGYGFNRPDGRTIAVIKPELAESGIILENLSVGVRKHINLVGNHLGRLIDGNFGKFEAMNSALWNSGLFLYVPDNTVIEKPIMLSRQPAESATFLRLLVVVGKNAEVTIIDDYSGDYNHNIALVNSAVELFTGDSSRVRYANTQRLGGNIKSYITQRAMAGKDSRVFLVYGGLGSAVSKVNVGTILNGRGAESRLSGVIFGSGKQHFDYHTRHHHKADESYSNIDLKVILKDKAVSAYTGLIKINENALNCEAYQENRNLLLNKGPKAESIPELEILCDQVRCSHGATMGPIDPEMLFYLESRGISHNEAVNTIVSGFVEPTINQMPTELRDMLREMVLTKLKER